MAELIARHDDQPERVRRAAAGRKPEATKQPGLVAALQELVASAIHGDPEAVLLWMSRSQRRLAEELGGRGFQVSHRLVGRLLDRLGFSLEGNRKAPEQRHHPDRDAQFEHINARITAFQTRKQPTISVATKKRELVGDLDNSEPELRPRGSPAAVRVGVKVPEPGRVVPYNAHEIAANAGWVSVGIDDDTAAFAVESVRRWWRELGTLRYPRAKRLLITADCGGSDGVQLRPWKRELQKLANEIGVAITVAHLPPGTRRWSRVEHRLFAFITQNWRGKPLVSHQVVVQLIGAATTRTQLSVACRVDDSLYQKVAAFSDDEIEAINLTCDEFHGEWNYTVSPSLGSG